MIVLIVLLTGALIIALYYHWTFNYWKHRGIKALRSNLIFGNLTDVVLGKVPVFRMFKEVYEKCRKSGEKCMGFYFLNIPTLVLADPELVKQILTKDFNYFTDRPFYHDVEDPLTINIASARGNQWRQMREQLSPAFSPSKMKNVCHTLLKVGDQLKPLLDKSSENYEVVNLTDVIGKYIVDAIGMCVFGIECNTLKNLNVEFKNFAENTFGGSFTQNIKFMLSIMCPAVLHFFKTPFSSPEIQNFYLNLVKSTVEYREKNNVVRNDLMHSLIQLRNNIDIRQENNLIMGNASENEKSLKIQEITAQILIFFGASYENSSSTILLYVYELASNKDVQNNLRNEIFTVLEKYGGRLSYDAIMEMTYLEKCFAETLRKHGLSSMTSRICTKSYHVPNTDVILDVGNLVHIPIYEFHRDPEYYPNPEKFDPERFSPENKAMRPSYSYLAFGEGQRNCIGIRLAALLVKIFVITFLSNYNFTINPKMKLPPDFSKSNMIVTFKDPLYLNIEKI